LLSLLLEISLASEEEEAGVSNEYSVEGEEEGEEVGERRGVRREEEDELRMEVVETEIGVVGEDSVGAGVGRKTGVAVDEIEMWKTTGFCIMKCG
jgi:hypothetical protein